MIVRLLHGFTDRLPSLRCCGKRWNDLPRHRSFAHGEEVVSELTPEEYVGTLFDWEPPLPCFCGAPATHWVYDVMGDGQTINGFACCEKHQEEA